MDTKSVVSSYISRLRLLDRSGLYIAAVSGGADSVALLLLLLDMGYKVEAAHCNFHLRGEESDRDENFVRELCDRLRVPLHIVHFDTKEYASLHKVSIEMAARTLRYGYFEQLRRDIGAAGICVAHHRDDSVETLLMNLVRGTGMQGLAGIRPVNGNVIRPLLCISREEIERFLSAAGQEFITDSTNLNDDFVRNKFRLNVIPLLKEINPNVQDNIRRTSEYVSGAIRILDGAIASSVERVVTERSETGVIIDIHALESEISPEYLIYEILKDYGFSSAQIENISGSLDSRTGAVFVSSGYELLIDRGRIVVERKGGGIRPIKIPETGVYVIRENVRISFRIVAVDDNFTIPHSRNTACLDADKVSFPLMLREVRAGERFVPFGMRGSKLISDYLTDRKKTLFQKRSQLVLTDASDNVLWLVNERPDNRYRISETGSKALIVSFATS